MTFGSFIRRERERRLAEDSRFSLRQVAQLIDVEPAYLSKVERDEVAPPWEATIVRLARELDEDADLLLALAGKISSDLADIIRRRPRLFAQLIRELKTMPDHAILRIVREVRDGDWELARKEAGRGSSRSSKTGWHSVVQRTGRHSD